MTLGERPHDRIGGDQGTSCVRADQALDASARGVQFDGSMMHA